MLQLSFDHVLSHLPSQWLKRWAARLLLLCLLVLTGILVVSFVRMTWTERQISNAIAQQQAINEAQRVENERLKAEAEFRQSDAFVEQAAREQLGMAREDETVLLPTVVIPPTPQSEPAAEAAISEHAAAVPNYRRWWNAFFPAQTAP